MNLRAIAISCALLMLFLSPRGPRAWADNGPPASSPVPVLDKTKANNATGQKTANGMKVSSASKRRLGILQTQVEYKAPLIITAVARADATSIRLLYGRDGFIILNWERGPDELHFRSPKGGREQLVANKGSAPRNAWVTVRWIIDAKESKVEVDGEERGKFSGDFAGFSGTVGVGTYADGTIEVKSLTVASIDRKPANDRKPGTDGAPPVATVEPALIEVSVPTEPPTAAKVKPPGATLPVSNPNAIERPEFQENAKRLEKSLTSVTSMMVHVAADGQASGLTSDIIATVSSQSRNGESAGIGFVRPDVDPTMKTAFEEAVRAIELRYPYWEPGHIEISFGEKFVAHGGPSAGAAFGLLMLSTLEGFDIDPKCAVTGDITVDWKVRKVGAVTAKLRGATLDKCSYAVIPEGNQAAFADMAILYGNPSIWDIQVFSAATLQDVTAVARTSRQPQLARAIKLFDELRPQLEKDQKLALQSLQTRATLKQILELAPNHLSAKRLLAISEDGGAKTLSVNGTLYQLSILLYPYQSLLNSKQPVTRDTLPAYVTTLARERLVALRPMAAKELQLLIADASGYIEAFDGLASKTISPATFTLRARNLEARIATLDKDPNFIENLVHEGY